MSWIEKELKRRREAAPVDKPVVRVVSDKARVQDLWRSLLEANAELPPELRLAVAEGDTSVSSPDGTVFQKALKAPNGGILGFTEDSIRYIWPELSSRKKSNNFWIRWSEEKNRFLVSQRVDASVPPTIARYYYKEVCVDTIIRHLVLGERLRPKSVRRRRTWF